MCVCVFECRDALQAEIEEKQAEIDKEREAKQEAMDERYKCMYDGWVHEYIGGRELAQSTEFTVIFVWWIIWIDVVG